MHGALLEAIKLAFASIAFTSISTNEVITIDNIQWLSIHCYVVYGWKSIPIHLCVEIVGISATSNNVFGLIVKNLLNFGGLKLDELGAKLINMGYDGNNVFQSHKTSVTM
jgi:hypothetical protein